MEPLQTVWVTGAAGLIGSQLFASAKTCVPEFHVIGLAQTGQNPKTSLLSAAWPDGMAPAKSAGGFLKTPELSTQSKS